MKHRIRKLTSLLLSLSLISALTLPAAASNALGEDLSAKDTLLHQETQLSTNVFWSTTYSDLRTENLHENKTGLRLNFSRIFAGMVLIFTSRQVIM